MKKIIILLLMILTTIAVSQAVMIETGDRLYFDCVHNETGRLVGTTADIDCWDQDGNLDVDGAGTNVEAGIFYYVFEETDDRYFCKINCADPGIDYVIPVLQGTVSDIDDILADTNELQTDDYPTALTTIDNEIATIQASLDGNLSDILADTAEIVIDTAAQDTAGEWNTLMDLSSETVGTASVCTVATSVTNPVKLQVSSVNSSTVGTLNSGDIGVGAFASASITADAIATDAIGAAELAANSIGASEIATDAIGAAEIAASAIGTSEWAAEADNNGINWGDITNPTTAQGLSGTTIAIASLCSATTSVTNPVNVNDSVVVLSETILADTNELQTDDYPTRFDTVDSSLTAIDNYVDTEVAEILQAIKGNDTEWGATGVSGPVSINDTVVTLLENALADTNELQSNQNWNVWDDGTRTLTTADWTTDSDITTQNSLILTAISQNQSKTETRGDIAWITAVGFSTHSASDVDNLISDELIAQALTGNLTEELAFDSDITTITDNQDTLLGALTSNFSSIISTLSTISGYIDTEVSEILGAIQGNASLWLTATGFSTHSAADVDNLISDEAIEAALRQNASEWDNTADVTSLCTLNNATSIRADIGSLNDISTSDLDTECISPTELDSEHGDGLYNTSNTGTGTTPAAVWAYGTRTLTALDEDDTTIDLDTTTVSASAVVSDANMRQIALYVVNSTVNNTYPGNPQALGSRVYYIEVYP